jgi:hypothetical protein
MYAKFQQEQGGCLKTFPASSLEAAALDRQAERTSRERRLGGAL